LQRYTATVWETHDESWDFIVWIVVRSFRFEPRPFERYGLCSRAIFISFLSWTRIDCGSNQAFWQWFWGKEFADNSEFGSKVSKLWQKIVRARTWARILSNISSLTERKSSFAYVWSLFSKCRLDLTQLLLGTYHRWPVFYNLSNVEPERKKKTILKLNRAPLLISMIQNV